MHNFNERGCSRKVFEKRHLNLEALRCEESLHNNGYLHIDLPLLPIPVEFEITKVIHVTGESGMSGILGQPGFRLPQNGESGTGSRFLWWSLTVDDVDRLSAERRFLQTFLPHLTPEEVENHPPFLGSLTTSTAFRQQSRYGHFKFTFSLKELLQKYREQFCDGGSPVLRVYGTEVYKKEIVHVVVIHSPDVHDFDEYPILQDNTDEPCAVRNGSLVWRPRAINEPCIRRLVTEEGGRGVRVEEYLAKNTFFMWEHGALAFHIPQGETLRFERDELLTSLSACNVIQDVFLGNRNEMMSYEDAKMIVGMKKQML